jgi:hypothetical protein
MLLAALCCAMLLGSCTGPGSISDRVPENLARQAIVGEYRNIRFYSDDIDSLKALAQDRVRDVQQAYAGQSYKGRPVNLNYLSISGGGGDGAFGAGLLNGWTASGTRPKFDVVTGISTGALIAPFAFLGPEYDSVLKHAYTTTSTADIEDTQPIPALLGLAPSLSSNAAFERLVASYFTPEVLTAIAMEYRKGRMLLIGTTNLDAQRAVIWDIGAIALSGRNDALDLTRRIIMASASIPGVFPPVHIRVNADGKTFDELHVDGGVTRQVFLFPPGYDPRLVDAAIGWKPHRRAFVIRNSMIDAQYETVDAKLLPIAGRSISTLIKTQGVGDLYRIFLVSQRENMDFNLAYIPYSFKETSKSMFDPAYMQSLYDLAYEQGSRGYRWHKEPPGLDPHQN